jgi:electron transfer flavoprotein beta subunit
MRAVMPALAQAKPASLGGDGTTWLMAEVPKQRRETRVVKDSSPDEIAKEIVTWIKG